MFGYHDNEVVLYSHPHNILQQTADLIIDAVTKMPYDWHVCQIIHLLMDFKH
jgi:hypothetical protein